MLYPHSSALLRIVLASSNLLLLASSALRADAAELTQTLEQATSLVAVQDLREAAILFDRVRSQTERGSATWDQATFGTALCAQHATPITRSGIDRAVERFEELLEASPNGKYSPRAMLNLGRIKELSDFYRDPIDLPGARAMYERVIATYPDEPICGEAVIRVAGTYVQTFEPEQVRQGIKVLEDWLANHPDEPLASVMWQYIGDSYFEPLKEYGKSVQAYEQVDRLGWVERGNQGPVYWRIAQVADRYLNDRDIAVKYYTKIIQETPTSGKAYESQRALERLGAPVPPIGLFEAFNTPAGAEPTGSTPDGVAPEPSAPAMPVPSAEGSRP